MNKANEAMVQSKGILKKLSLFSFTLSLFFLIGILDSYGMVIKANKVTQDLPLDPEAPLWNSAKSFTIPLASQVITRPRHYEASVKEIDVRALHNGREIVFLLEWKDPTKDSSDEWVHTFSDGVALQFPSEREKTKPHFAMGHEEALVNIWHWKAIQTEVQDPKTPYAVVDDFLAGIKAGNPVSRKGVFVQDLQAGGFGTLTGVGEIGSSPSGTGKWISDRWMVVFKRSLQSQGKHTVNFIEGGLTPLAIAVWDGSKGERGARKSISTWYYVALETEIPISVYLFPFLAWIGSSGLLLIGIHLLRKRRKAADA